MSTPRPSSNYDLRPTSSTSEWYAQRGLVFDPKLNGPADLQAPKVGPAPPSRVEPPASASAKKPSWSVPAPASAKKHYDTCKIFPSTNCPDCQKELQQESAASAKKSAPEQSPAPASAKRHHPRECPHFPFDGCGNCFVLQEREHASSMKKPAEPLWPHERSASKVGPAPPSKKVESPAPEKSLTQVIREIDERIANYSIDHRTPPASKSGGYAPPDSLPANYGDIQWAPTYTGERVPHGSSLPAYPPAGGVVFQVQPPQQYQQPQQHHTVFAQSGAQVVVNHHHYGQPQQQYYPSQQYMQPQQPQLQYNPPQQYMQPQQQQPQITFYTDANGNMVSTALPYALTGRKNK